LFEASLLKNFNEILEKEGFMKSELEFKKENNALKEELKNLLE